MAYAGQIGLRIILDNHRSEAGETAEENGLWYTAQYPEADWINDWEMLAERYSGNSTVIGMDLRNEPHAVGSEGACWTCASEQDDWHLAAERGGDAILAINPKLLIFVEGTDKSGSQQSWWGGNLEGVKKAPVVLSVAHQLVYSAHEYGPVLYAQTWFNKKTTTASLESRWNEMWGYISKDKIAPVWIGEFGTLHWRPAWRAARPLARPVVRVPGELPGEEQERELTYWDMGEDNYALLDGNWDSTPVSAQKQKMLAKLEFKLASGPAEPPPQTAACHVSYSVVNSWNTGFQAAIAITNTGTTNVSSWALGWTFADGEAITDLWNGIASQSGAQVTVSNASYNAAIPAGGSVQGIGFTANDGGETSAAGELYAERRGLQLNHAAVLRERFHIAGVRTILRKATRPFSLPCR